MVTPPIYSCKLNKRLRMTVHDLLDAAHVAAYERSRREPWATVQIYRKKGGGGGGLGTRLLVTTNMMIQSPCCR